MQIWLLLFFISYGLVNNLPKDGKPLQNQLSTTNGTPNELVFPYTSHAFVTGSPMLKKEKFNWKNTSYSFEKDPEVLVE